MQKQLGVNTFAALEGSSDSGCFGFIRYALIIKDRGSDGLTFGVSLHHNEEILKSEEHLNKHHPVCGLLMRDGLKK